MVWKGEELYRKHAEGVYRYLFVLCREADTAERLMLYVYIALVIGLAVMSVRYFLRKD